MLVLLQSAEGSNSPNIFTWGGTVFVSVLVLCSVLLGSVTVLYFLMKWLRRGFKRPDEPESATGFTLSDLRDLHRRGDLTDEEYERAKGKLLAAFKKPPDPPKPSV